MPYGTVARYFPAKGFGFIQAQKGPDVFFHVTALGACESQPKIEPGQAVKYELASETEQPVAGRRPRRDTDDAEGAARPASEPQIRAKLVELIERIPASALNSVANYPQAARHPRSRQKKPTWRR